MNISSLTLDQLKAMAYDMVVMIQQSQNNLAIISKELAARAEQKPDPRQPIDGEA